MDVIKKLERIKVLPLYTVKSLSSVKLVGKSLVEGGIPIVEVALRTGLAYDAVEILNENNNMLVGAGTVRSVEQAKKVIEKGAKFIISPGIIPEVITYCNENKVLCVPGAVTPTEIEYASSFGIKILKYFPANVYGGLNGLKSLSGPYADIKFIPTGGINENNLNEYLQIKNVLAAGGSFVIPEQYVKDNDFEGMVKWISAIERKTKNL